MELYNKYRPQTPAEILGNDLAVKSIQKEIENGTHVFLLTGGAGCGKTTAARVFAKVVGADDLTIHEINSSENRGIDTTREIMEEVRYAPVGGGKTVYILDEVHQQTAAAQNSLLKVLEDCPEHVFFFLATTNEEKLIAPLKTRCSIIKMKPLDQNTMFGLLRKVAFREGYKVGEKIGVDVLRKVAVLSDGSSRKALKLLSGVLYLDNDDQRKEYLEKNNVSEENQDIIELCRKMMHFGAGGWDAYMEVLEKAKDELQGNAESVRQMCMSYAVSCLKKGLQPRPSAMLKAFSQADCYRNGKFAIYQAIWDFVDMLSDIEG